MQPIGNDAVVLDTATETYFELNEVSSWVMQQLTEPATPTALAAALTEHFDVDEATAVADIRELLLNLRHLGLIVSQ